MNRENSYLTACREAVSLTARGDGDRLVTIATDVAAEVNLPVVTDDGVSALPAIDLLRFLVADYQEAQEATD